jgi:hypothetical protein
MGFLTLSSMSMARNNSFPDFAPTDIQQWVEPAHSPVRRAEERC